MSTRNHVRRSVWSGILYPGSREEILREIGSTRFPRNERLRGLLLPHHSSSCAWPVALPALAPGLPQDPVYFVFGANHTGRGEPVAVYPGTAWETPLGTVSVDTRLAGEIVSGRGPARYDWEAFEDDYSVETVLPLLQAATPGRMRIVPILVYTEDVRELETLASSIVRATHRLGRKAVVLASTDLTHYAPAEELYRLDNMILQGLVSSDPSHIVAAAEYGASPCSLGVLLAFAFYTRSLGGVVEIRGRGMCGDSDGPVGVASARFESSTM